MRRRNLSILGGLILLALVLYVASLMSLADPFTGGPGPIPGERQFQDNFTPSEWLTPASP